MSNFESGQTVYDKNGKSFEYHHTHNGVHFCYPIFEYQDHDGQWYDAPSDQLIGLSTIYEDAPTQHMSERVVDLQEKINELQQEVNRCNGQVMKVRSELSKAEIDYDRYMEEFGTLTRVGKLMAGDAVVALKISSGDWIPPEGLGGRDVSVLVLRYNPQNKGWRFAKKRGGIYGDGYDTVELFDNVQQADDFVAVMFEKLCAEVSRRIRTKPAEVFDPGNSYTTPHINGLRKWITKWPHLEMPDALVEAEQVYLHGKRDREIEAAKKRLEELEGSK